jgi:hypothetical protein
MRLALQLRGRFSPIQIQHVRRKTALLPIDNRAVKDAISLPPMAGAELW